MRARSRARGEWVYARASRNGWRHEVIPHGLRLSEGVHHRCVSREGFISRSATREGAHPVVVEMFVHNLAHRRHLCGERGQASRAKPAGARARATRAAAHLAVKQRGIEVEHDVAARGIEERRRVDAAPPRGDESARARATHSIEAWLASRVDRCAGSGNALDCR